MHILHDRGGGTGLHVRGLVAALHGWRHVVASIAGDRIELRAFAAAGAAAPRRGIGVPDQPDRAAIERSPGESWRDLFASIIGAFHVSLIHVHHLAGSPFSLASALPALGVPYGVTIHDLWFACPTVTLIRDDGRYCGGETALDECRRCLAAQPAFASIDIGAWRRRHGELLGGASFAIAPSQWAADMALRYFPALAGRTHVVPHALPPSRLLDPMPDSDVTPEAHPGAGIEPQRQASMRAHSDRHAGLPLPDDGTPVVACLGAIGPDKGARRIERLAALARDEGRAVRFVVIGYLDTRHQPWQSDDARLTVHGRYLRSDLPALIAHYRPRFACFPSEGPESFSYTLSEAWAAHLPALVPPIGALAERVKATGAGWIMRDEEWRDDARLLARIVELAAGASERPLAPAPAAGVTPAPFAAARRAILPDARRMAEATAGHYACALRAAAVAATANGR